MFKWGHIFKFSINFGAISEPLVGNLVLLSPFFLQQGSIHKPKFIQAGKNGIYRAHSICLSSSILVHYNQSPPRRNRFIVNGFEYHLPHMKGQNTRQKGKISRSWEKNSKEWHIFSSTWVILFATWFIFSVPWFNLFGTKFIFPASRVIFPNPCDIFPSTWVIFSNTWDIFSVPREFNSKECDLQSFNQ